MIQINNTRALRYRQQVLSTPLYLCTVLYRICLKLHEKTITIEDLCTHRHCLLEFGELSELAIGKSLYGREYINK